MNVDSVLSTPDTCINLISAYQAPDIRFHVTTLYRSLSLCLSVSVCLCLSLSLSLSQHGKNSCSTITLWLACVLVVEPSHFGWHVCLLLSPSQLGLCLSPFWLILPFIERKMPFAYQEWTVHDMSLNAYSMTFPALLVGTRQPYSIGPHGSKNYASMA